MAVKINIHTLLDAGCHYGHQTRRWNPKMRPYIFGERNGIYILDLKQTIINGDRAYTMLRDTAAKGGTVLFVGTKKQAQESIQTQAERAGMPYINQRWLGGMLTNFVTKRSRIDRMEELEAMVADGRMAARGKKEQAVLGKELEKLQRNLGGARDLHALPQAIFVVDTKREEIAIREANRLHIPVVGLLAYVILRPSSYLVDREEQDLDIALREHQLSHYGICPKCGAPIDRDFVVCPICNTQVRNVCPTCHRPLNADWKVCPYCRTRIQ